MHILLPGEMWGFYMPAQNVIRQYGANEYYHVYNRGVEKRIIFIEPDDYKVFMYYLFIYLAPPEIVNTQYPKLKATLRRNNLSNEVKLLAFVLMPNHFHFLLKQTVDYGVTKILRQLTNAYTAYFNKKHDRVGGLLQGVFKAAHIQSDEQLLQVSRYIHKNPLAIEQYSTYDLLKLYPWSSYPVYLGRQQSDIVSADEILQYFSTAHARTQYEVFTKEEDDPMLLPARIQIDECVV